MAVAIPAEPPEGRNLFRNCQTFFLSSEPRSGSPIRLRGEKTVDITVARRCKKRGISWQRNGANALLKLRVLKLNGDWDAYWQEWRKEFPRYAASFLITEKEMLT
jgi:hypothetical protein